eukprot:4271853-Amphidinium_carterae.2
MSLQLLGYSEGYAGVHWASMYLDARDMVGATSDATLPFFAAFRGAYATNEPISIVVMSKNLRKYVQEAVVKRKQVSDFLVVTSCAQMLHGLMFDLANS